MNEVVVELLTHEIHNSFLTCWRYFVCKAQKNGKIIISLLLVSLALTACTHPMVGKTLPPATGLLYISGYKGDHIVKFEGGEAELDYNWFINKEENNLTLIGTFSAYDNEWKAFANSLYKYGQMTISVLLLNANLKVIKVEQIFIPIDSDINLVRGNKFTSEFEKTFPFNKEYKYLTFQVNLRGLY